jgi:hypothetical protein
MYVVPKTGKFHFMGDEFGPRIAFDEFDERGTGDMPPKEPETPPENNDGNEDDLGFSWDDEPDDFEEKENKPAPQPGAQQGGDVLQRHLDSLQFPEFKLSDDDREALSNGDMEPFQKHFQTFGKQIYSQMLSTVGQIMKHNNAQILEQASQHTQKYTANTQLLRTIKEDFAPARDKVTGPIVESIVGRLKSAGKSDEEIPALTKKVFKRIISQSLDAFEDDEDINPSRAPSGGPSLRRQEPETDWIKLIGG